MLEVTQLEIAGAGIQLQKHATLPPSLVFHLNDFRGLPAGAMEGMMLKLKPQYFGTQPPPICHPHFWMRTLLRCQSDWSCLLLAQNLSEGSVTFKIKAHVPQKHSSSPHDLICDLFSGFPTLPPSQMSSFPQGPHFCTTHSLHLCDQPFLCL